MNSQDTARLLPKKQNYLIDLDGVVYEGSSLITGEREAVEFFRLSGKKFFLLLTAPPNTLNLSLKNLGSLACRASLGLSNSGEAVTLYVRRNRLDALVRWISAAIKLTDSWKSPREEAL
jgi:ribonucleotide monophosphatase NagD (HAD superfamily)